MTHEDSYNTVLTPAPHEYQQSCHRRTVFRAKLNNITIDIIYLNQLKISSNSPPHSLPHLKGHPSDLADGPVGEVQIHIFGLHQLLLLPVTKTR